MRRCIAGRYARNGAVLAGACLLAGAGCGSRSDRDADVDDSGLLAGGQRMAVVATSDYTVGALATVGIEDGAITDEITAIGGDPAVVTTGDRVVVLERSGADAVRIYHPPDLRTPVLEFATGDATNPHDAEICGDLLWISLYNAVSLPAYDPETGVLLAAVDLSAWDDGDGIPEASSLVAIGGTLYVALEQLAQGSAHWPAAGGTVIAVDCASRAVTGSWEPGPAPSISAWPADPTKLAVRTGAYFDAEGEPTWDGGLWLLDPQTGEQHALGLDEAEHAINLVGFAAVPSGRILATATDADWNFQALCLDSATGEVRNAFTTGAFLADIQVNDRGEAWIAARTSWTGAKEV